MSRRVLRTVVVLALLAPSEAWAEPLTLFSTFDASNTPDAGGIRVTGAAPDPASNGLRLGFQGFSDVADYVRIDDFDSIVYALSTTEDWPQTTSLSVFMSLFADDSGTPGEQLAGAYVRWPLTPTPTLFHANAGHPFSLLLSTTSFYWFTLSLRNGEDGSFDPTRSMTWHFAEGTRTPGLRLIGTTVPEPALSLLLAAGLLSGALWRQRRR